MKEKAKTALHWVYRLLIILLLVFIVIQLVPMEVSLQLFGFRPLVVVTDSMTGELNTLDLVVIKRATPETLRPNDIITFYAPDNSPLPKNSLITHFIASIEPQGDGWEIHTKSNLSKQWDDWTLTEHDIVGKKWFTIPKMGHVIMACKNPIIARNSIVLLLLLLAILSLWPKSSVPASETDE